MSEKKTETTETPTEGSEMGKKLKAAGKKAEKAKAERRERVVKGSHLLKALLDEKTLEGLTQQDMSGFVKITGAAGPGKRVLIAKKGGRVDFSGFSIEHEAVTQISEEDARAKHLGKVRGQLDFDKADETVLEAFGLALAELRVAPPAEEPKPAKPAKEPKAPKVAPEATN